MAKEKPFNNPFGALKIGAKPDAAKPAAAPKPVAPKAKAQQVSTDEESALFLSAMGAFDEVKPVREKRPAQPAPAAQQKATADDVEALIELAELVASDTELVVEQSAAGVRGLPTGFDGALLGRLAPGAELDVQALEPPAARAALERFIVDAQGRGVRAVRVVTGPERRQLAVSALTQGKLVRKVLAFSGGVEALDVLLRAR